MSGSHRISCDPTADHAYRAYLDVARRLDGERDDPAKAFGLLFMKRFEPLCAALPAANRLFKKRLETQALVVSAGVFADYCWPLRNETEAAAFGTPHGAF